jgi:hypothetical protein
MNKILFLVIFNLLSVLCVNGEHAKQQKSLKHLPISTNFGTKPKILKSLFYTLGLNDKKTSHSTVPLRLPIF